MGLRNDEYLTRVGRHVIVRHDPLSRLEANDGQHVFQQRQPKVSQAFVEHEFEAFFETVEHGHETGNQACAMPALLSQ